MKEAFKGHKFTPEATKLLGVCDEIIRGFQAQGLRMTVRQLFYQVVGTNLIRNEQRAYKNLIGLISNARLAGLVDWDAIEDRIRRPRMPVEFEDLDELFDAALSSYRLPRWRGQPHYVELWCEKEALSGIIEPITRSYHVHLMINRGYSSQTAMYDASKRYIAAMDDPGRQALHLLYFGDMDPSGEDMVRDCEARLRMFGVDPLEVRKVALTMDQVEQYDLPPNPAKMSDSRSPGYVARHGAQSWEIDALRPDVLDRLVRGAIESVMDAGMMNKVLAREKKDKAALTAALASSRKPKGAGGGGKGKGGR